MNQVYVRPELRVLEEKEILTRINSLPGWTYKNNKISKEFTFKKFMDVVAFVVKLAPFCEANDHHPDMHISYKKVLFELQRFELGGKVTDMDFKEAEYIEQLFKEWNP